MTKLLVTVVGKAHFCLVVCNGRTPRLGVEGQTASERGRDSTRQQKRKPCHGNSAGSLNIHQNGGPSSSTYFIFWITEPLLTEWILLSLLSFPFWLMSLYFSGFCPLFLFPSVCTQLCALSSKWVNNLRSKHTQTRANDDVH